MKKLFIIPAFMLLISSGVTSNAPVRVPVSSKVESVPVNTKIDSINVSAMELSHLMEQL